MNARANNTHIATERSLSDTVEDMEFISTEEGSFTLDNRTG